MKTATDHYIKTLTVSFVNKRYFLYDEKNIIEQTFITEINKLISVYGSISYFNKKNFKRNSPNNFVQKPLKISCLKGHHKKHPRFSADKNCWKPY